MQALFIIRTLNHIICLPLFNIYNWFISQNPDCSSFRKIQFFFSFHKIQIYRIATSFSDSEIVPWNARSFYYQNAPSHYMFTFVKYLQLVHFAKSRFFLLICNKQYVAAIGSFRKIQIFFFISQNPDFINVVENFDFAKSRFFLFRRIQIFFYFAESIFRNFAKSIFREIQLAICFVLLQTLQIN